MRMLCYYFFFNHNLLFIVYTLDKGSEYNIRAVFRKSNFYHTAIAEGGKLRCFSCRGKYVLCGEYAHYIIITVNQINP
jgi:hypothetical protein